MPDEDIKPIGFPIRRILLDMSPPKAAHGFAWARVGDQFMLEVGYFDLKVMSDLILRQTQKSNEPQAETEGLDLFITDRFVMDFASANRLLEIMNSLKAEFDKSLEKMKSHVE